MEDETVQEGSNSSILLMSGKEMLQEVQKKGGSTFSLVGKTKVILTSTNLEGFPNEVKKFLDEYTDIIVDELQMLYPL